MLMRYVCFTLLLGLALAISSPVLVAEEKAKPAATGPSFDKLKKLVGDWVLLDKDGKPTDTIAASIKLTAAGSVIQETLFPGAPHEMVTMYHMDGKDLMLTHYCALGNQPRMKAEQNTAANKFVFKYSGATNLKSENDMHMHEGTLTIVDDDHYNAEWVGYEKGKPGNHSGSFKLERKKK